MAFENSIFCGYAKRFVIGNKIIENTFVEIDLRNKKINIYFSPENINTKEKFPPELKNLLKKNISIEEMEIILPNFKLYAKEITDIFISRYKISSLNVGETFLSSSFGLTDIDDNNLYSLDKVSIIPRKGFLEFILKDIKFGKNHREILFENFYPDIPSPIEFRKLYSSYGILLKKPSKNLISVEISKNVDNTIDNIRTTMKIALSYLQGLDVKDFIELDNNNLKIYFSSTQDKKSTFPVIPYKWIEEFIIKFYEYLLNISKQEQERVEMLILNIIYGKTKKMIIDTQLSHLMLALEIICEGKVEKRKIMEKLNLSSYDARFILEVRNKILHGYSFKRAVHYAFNLVANENNKDKSLFYPMKSKWQNFELIFKVYLGIISILDKYILNLINYEGKWFNPLNEFSEEYVNEILLEDKELLEELRKR